MKYSGLLLNLGGDFLRRSSFGRWVRLRQSEREDDNKRDEVSRGSERRASRRNVQGGEDGGDGDDDEGGDGDEHGGGDENGGGDSEDGGGGGGSNGGGDDSKGGGDDGDGGGDDGSNGGGEGRDEVYYVCGSGGDQIGRGHGMSGTRCEDVLFRARITKSYVLKQGLRSKSKVRGSELMGESHGWSSLRSRCKLPLFGYLTGLYTTPTELSSSFLVFLYPSG